MVIGQKKQAEEACFCSCNNNICKSANRMILTCPFVRLKSRKTYIFLHKLFYYYLFFILYIIILHGQSDKTLESRLQQGFPLSELLSVFLFCLCSNPDSVCLHKEDTAASPPSGYNLQEYQNLCLCVNIKHFYFSPSS